MVAKAISEVTNAECRKAEFDADGEQVHGEERGYVSRVHTECEQRSGRELNHPFRWTMVTAFIPDIPVAQSGTNPVHELVSMICETPNQT